MNIKKISKANVEQTNFTIGFPCHFRLEMKVNVEETNGDVCDVWSVPLLIEDESWSFSDDNVMTYTQDKGKQKEIDKYKVLEGTYNSQKQEVRFFTDNEKEELKKRIFELCGEKMVQQRTVVEEQMFRFCSNDFEKLPDNEQEKILAFFG